MKRRLKKSLLLVPIALLVIVCAAIYWIAGTNQGARWLLQKLSAGEVTIEARAVAGTLIRGLTIEQFRASWQDGAAEAGKLLLRWQPARLLAGRISITELSGAAILIRDNRPESTQPTSINWPRSGALLPHLNIHIDKIGIDGLRYERLNKPPAIVDRAAAYVVLAHGTLRIGDLLLVTPMGRAEGLVTLGISRRSLHLEAKIAPAEPVAGFDHIDAKLDLHPGAALSGARGTFSAAGLSGTRTLAACEGSLVLTNDSFGVNDFRLYRPGMSGEVRGDAGIGLGIQTVNARLTFDRIDARPWLPLPTDISGNLTLSGRIDQYDGRLRIANKGPGEQKISLDAAFRGTRGSMTLTSLTGSWLEGTLSGAASVSWHEGISANASLKLRALNPAVLLPVAPGVVNLDLEGAVRLPSGGSPRADVALRLLRSRLHGQSLSGAMKAHLRHEDLLLDLVQIRGRALALRAHGSLRNRILLAADLPDLSLLVPSLKGRVSAQGWIRRKNAIVSGSISAKGGNLASGEARAGSVEVRGSGELRADAPFTLQASVSRGSYGDFRADSLKLDAAGTPVQHQAGLVFRSGAYAARLKVSGSYEKKTWKGTVLALSGNDPVGTWRQQGQALLSFSAAGFSLSGIRIRGSGGEQLELDAGAGQQPKAGSVALAWRDVDISRANVWLSGIMISGKTSGSLAGKLTPDQHIDAAVQASLSGGAIRRKIAQGELSAEISSATLAAAWRGDAAEGKLEIALAQYGKISAGARLPLPARLPLAFDPNGPLRISVKGQLRETGTLSLLFPGLIQESRGEITVDLRVGGTWNAPEPGGKLLLDKAGCYFPAAGIHLKDIRVEAAIEGSSVHITSVVAHSGKGILSGSATITLRGKNIAHYEVSLKGDRFQALYLPQMQLAISPKLELSGTPEAVTVRGEVRIPEFLIHGPPRESTVKPSEDVVIAGRGEEAAPARFSLDLEVKMILGDRVIVKASGADAQLAGELLVTARSETDVRARGEVTVKKGKYSAYGVGLDIARGRVLFAGGPIDNPGLDILAVKTVNEVKAGVLVSGTVKKPVVKLYSQPAMPDTDVLAYMVLGHPLGQDKEQGNYLMQAAGALLSAGQSVALQDQVKQHLGLDTIDVQTGAGTTSRSLVTIGKYLSSKLYVSYGRALFTGENLFRLRYKFARHWELESHSGETSGVDLYYMIQFD